MPDHHFDKSGFVFFLKSSGVFVGLLAGAQYAPQAVLERLDPYSDTAQAAVLLSAREPAHSEEVRDDADELAPQKNDRSVRLGLAGDMMLDRSVETRIDLYGGGDPDFSFRNIRSYLATFDILFGNVEGPVSDKGADRGSLYSFRMRPEVAPALASAGFDVVSVANNHMGDYGDEAMADTFYRLNEAGIVYAGGGLNEDEAYSARILAVEDMRIAFLAFSQFGKNYLEAAADHPGIAVISDERLKTSIKRAEEQSDVIVVSFHFGDEYESEPNAYQQRMSRLAIDLGADLVVGHHPHVVGPLERYRDGYIAYSLGNFIFDQDFSPETMEGALLDATIQDGRIDSARLVPVRLNEYFQPERANAALFPVL